MNDHALKVLEYDKVREIVARFAASEPGRAAVLRLFPSHDRGTVAGRLAETQELLGIFAAGEHPPLDVIGDIGPSLEKLRAAGVMLPPGELLAIAATLAAARRLKAFCQRFEGDATGRRAAPLLCARAAKITPLKPLEDAVHAAIDETGEVRDSASPELRRVRKLIGRTRDTIMDRLTRILRNEDAKNVVQEQLITVRDDRYVMPLKPNFRQSIKGVVHGHSGSRATLFVEPLEVVEQNNRLAELRMEEREETERILRELSALAAQDAAVIGASVEAAAGIDAITARARFGVEFKAVVPELSEHGGIDLRAARHPLIVAKRKAGAAQDAVPNDIDLSGNSRALIISGPNAGGKTVVLKTIGLLCLIAQAGIPVTAAEGSKLPVFSGIFADIGDEQSLEQDLSTFSSHVSQIAGILNETGKDSLVLLDELGSGTDPAEGAALGAAVLTRLLERGCVSVITTHHSVLKLFGAHTDGAVNAAMQFDPETLKPTYRFIPGRPGRSYGLDMAARLGVPDSVVQDARSRLTSDEADLDRLLEQVEEDARKLRSERQRAEQDLAAARRFKAETEQLLRKASEDMRTAKEKAKQEAREVLAGLRQKLKDLSGTAVIDRAAVVQERREIEDLAKKLEPADEGPDAQPPAIHGNIRSGDRVRVPKLKKTGTVLFAHGDMLEIDADGLKLRLPMRDVVPAERVPETSQAGPASGWGADLVEREGMPDRVNLLGLRVNEALAEVEQFMDRAGIQGFQQVMIIHGLGTGALKAAVTAFLKGHPLVASFRSGEPAEGGAGVAVVELKK